MSIFSKKNPFEFKPLPKLPNLKYDEPISHIRVLPPADANTHTTPVLYDWEKDNPELHEGASLEQKPNRTAELAPIIGTIGTANGFIDSNGNVDTTVVNHLQELPRPTSDAQ